MLFMNEAAARALSAAAAASSNPALNPAPFSRWTLRDKAAQRRLALRWSHPSTQKMRLGTTLFRVVIFVDTMPGVDYC
jgi:hypothetical protein